MALPAVLRLGHSPSGGDAPSQRPCRKTISDSTNVELFLGQDAKLLSRKLPLKTQVTGSRPFAVMLISHPEARHAS